ncbi:MAG TPA: Nif3-like dinuclear metal center hexameric protein [Verrucomicrobiae bacterium]|nr:Nif3-like dinuclear metal center hexameric protein [Verrucomicrobiae bacterium]
MVRFTDKLLRTAEVGDYDGAANGLQVENSGKVTRIAATVDASLATINLAIEADGDLLVVHHGLFWGPTHPWVGSKYKLMQLLIQHDLAVYSSHLPLDLHPELGNNAQLCAALGFTRTAPFFSSHGQDIGLLANAKVDRGELLKRLASATGGNPHLIAAGPSQCKRIGVVTGGAGGDLMKAAASGLDTFITGEGPHWTFAMAEELGVNVFYAGHYATETFGVKALAESLSRKFKVPWIFLDHPTGL